MDSVTYDFPALSIVQVLTILGLIHSSAGVLAAIVAVRKGESWSRWLPMGILLGTPALVMAVRLKPKLNPK
jgi:uncharacterized membrane protein HdeD (DUF308 family)